MIPGWVSFVPAAVPLEGELPQLHEAYYTDYAKGKASAITVRAYNNAEAELEVYGNRFVVWLRVASVGDVILVDRIE